MDRYYRIGDYPIKVEGGEADAILALSGFPFFETTSGEMVSSARKYAAPALCFRLVAEDQFAVVPFRPGEDMIREYFLHAFEFENISCTFSRMDTGEYVFRMVAPDRFPLVLHACPKTRICTIRGNKEPSMLRFALWMGYGLLTAGTETVAIHSSAISWQGKAVLFLGESGTGKSTHTRLWRENIPGAVLLNDDSPLLCNREGVSWVYGSPWSGKTPCYRNERQELAAVVRLTQAPCNRIRRLSRLEAIGALYPSCPPAFAHDDTLAGQVCASLSRVLSQVPVYHLACLPDADAARLAFTTVFCRNISYHEKNS